MTAVNSEERTLQLGPAPDGVFMVKETLPKWVIMKVVVAGKSGTSEEQMQAMYHMALACVARDERGRLDKYLTDDDDAFDRLEQALSELVEYWSGHPLARPEVSSTSSPTDEIVPSSRVVSFSRDVVEPATEEPPQVGRSEPWAV